MSNSKTAKAPLAGPLPGARSALILLLTINLFNYIDRQVLSATIPEIRKELLPLPYSTALKAAAGSTVVVMDPSLRNEEYLGYLTTAFILSYMVFAPVFGWLANRMKRWVIVGIGVILWSVASGASGVAGTLALPPWNATGAGLVLGTFTFLLISRCFVGIGEAAYGPVAPTMIADYYPVSKRGYVMAWFYAAIPVGSALGYVLGGQVNNLLSWPWAFYCVVPPGLLLGLLCFSMREPPKGATDLGTETRQQARFKDYVILLKTPSYVLDCLGMAMMTFALGGIAAWMPDYVNMRMLNELDPAVIPSFGGERGLLADINSKFGMIVVVSGLAATILGGLAGDWLRPRIPGSYFLVSAVAMFLGFPFFLAVLYTPFPVAWVFIFLACFCLFFNTGPTNTILANVTHPAMRAQAFAINIFVIHILGDAISPPIIGRIARAFPVDGKADLKAGFLAVSITILLAGVLWGIGTFFLERDTLLAPHRLDRRGID